MQIRCVSLLREQNPYLLTQIRKCVSRSLQQFNVRGNDISVIILQRQIAKWYIHYSMCFYWWASGNNFEVATKHFVSKSFKVVLRTEVCYCILTRKTLHHTLSCHRTFYLCFVHKVIWGKCWSHMISSHSIVIVVLLDIE